jgi:hypothetical protein
VIGKTRIRTEGGKGSITILRTKGWEPENTFDPYLSASLSIYQKRKGRRQLPGGQLCRHMRLPLIHSSRNRRHRTWLCHGFLFISHSLDCCWPFGPCAGLCSFPAVTFFFQFCTVALSCELLYMQKQNSFRCSAFLWCIYNMWSMIYTKIWS